MGLHSKKLQSLILRVLLVCCIHRLCTTLSHSFLAYCQLCSNSSSFLSYSNVSMAMGWLMVWYIYSGYYNHYHTVQVAMCAYSFVCTLVNALVLQGKKKHQRKLQVITTMSASGVFALVDGRKNTLHFLVWLHPSILHCIYTLLRT